MSRLWVNKKGILFTIGLMLLTFVVLSLAILIFHNAQEYESIVAKLAVLDRVYDLSTSIQQSARDIFELKCGIKVNITDSGVSFEEILPNDNIEIFNNSLSNFKRFIESNLSNINLTIGNMEEMPLVVMPHNIVYKHKTNWSDIEVLPIGVKPSGYSIFIETDENVSCSPPSSSGTFHLGWEIEGGEDSTCSSSSQDIQPPDELRINKVSGGNLIIIKVDTSEGLLINLTKDTSARVRTTIITSQPDAVMADSLNLTLDFNELGVYKESDVRII